MPELERNLCPTGCRSLAACLALSAHKLVGHEAMTPSSIPGDFDDSPRLAGDVDEGHPRRIAEPLGRGRPTLQVRWSRPGMEAGQRASMWEARPRRCVGRASTETFRVRSSDKRGVGVLRRRHFQRGTRVSNARMLSGRKTALRRCHVHRRPHAIRGRACVRSAKAFAKTCEAPI